MIPMRLRDANGKYFSTGHPLPTRNVRQPCDSHLHRTITALDGNFPPYHEALHWVRNTGNYEKARFFTDIVVRGNTTVLADDPTLTFRPYVKNGADGRVAAGEAVSFTRPRLKDLAAQIKGQFTTDVGATYTDNSTEINDNTTGVMTLNSLDTLANGDWIIIGCTSAPFCGMGIDVTNTNSNASDLTVAYQSGNTSTLAWTNVANMTDGTDTGATFAADGQITWDMPARGLWQPATINGICAYWVRLVTSAAWDASVTLTEVDLFFPIQAAIDVQADGDDVTLMLESISAGLTGTIAYSGTTRVSWR